MDSATRQIWLEQPEARDPAEEEPTCQECGAYASERCEPDCSARMEYLADEAAERAIDEEQIGGE